ncbi:MAG: pseudouridine-5'-phosphate glycosidase [Nitrospirae bacterium]|nr:pseudouridine-5'-phosphate glycosidase [Nitrospirota bacterium]
MAHNFIVSPQVKDALASGTGVVALESSVIAHGLPAPVNREAALEMEQAVRAAGAVPATIAVIDGSVRVGLSASAIDSLSRGEGIGKAGARDVPFLVATKGTAGTTVSATIRIAALAGIRIVATGGIGGVHRGAENTFDVSADLREISRTSVAVVSSGAKSVLDLPKTLEMLESLGVPVVGFRTGEFPAFYSARSGLHLEQRVQTPIEAAAVVRESHALGLGGPLIVQPVPEDKGLDPAWLEETIGEALLYAEREGIRGNAVTPFLLRAVAEATGGASIEANRALLVANARTAGEIAVELAATAGLPRS